MKKIVIILLMTILCFTACGKDESDAGSASSEASGAGVASTEASGETSGAAGSTAAGSPSAATTTGSTSASTTGKATNYQLSIPDDFTAVEIDGLEFCYVHEDSSSISMNVQDKDDTFGTITAEALNEALTATFAATYDKDITIIDLYFANNAVSGFPAYQYCFSYELDGTALTQLVVGVDASQTYTFTYTDMTGDWIQVFEASSQTIKITE